MWRHWVCEGEQSVSFKEEIWLMFETVALSFQEQVLHVCCFFFFWLCFLLRTIKMKVELLEIQKQGSAGNIQKQQWGEICPFHLLTWRLFLWRSCCWCAALRVRNPLIHSLLNLSRKDKWNKWSFRRTLRSDSKVCVCSYGNSILGCWWMWSGFQCSHSLALSALMQLIPSAWRSLCVQATPATAWRRSTVSFTSITQDFMIGSLTYSYILTALRFVFQVVWSPIELVNQSVLTNPPQTAALKIFVKRWVCVFDEGSK